MTEPYATARRLLRDLRAFDPLWFADERRHRKTLQVYGLVQGREWRTIKLGGGG